MAITMIFYSTSLSALMYVLSAIRLEGESEPAPAYTAYINDIVTQARLSSTQRAREVAKVSSRIQEEGVTPTNLQKDPAERTLGVIASSLDHQVGSVSSQLPAEHLKSANPQNVPPVRILGMDKSSIDHKVESVSQKPKIDELPPTIPQKGPGERSLGVNMSLRDHQDPCSTTIFASVFSTKTDWQRGGHVDPKLSYFSEFYNSVLSVPGGRVKAIIVHDNISDDIVTKYTTDDGTITFSKVDLKDFDKRLSLNDIRFAVYEKEMEKLGDKLPSSEMVFFTDIQDVKVKHNPCTLMHKHPTRLYVGSEPDTSTGFRNSWLQARFHNLSGDYLNWYEQLGNKNGKLMADPFYNTGIVGGPRDEAKTLLKRMNEVWSDPTLGAFRQGQEVKADMAVLNYVLHTKYDKNDIITGYPLNSKFNGHEDRQDVYLEHK